MYAAELSLGISGAPAAPAPRQSPFNGGPSGKPVPIGSVVSRTLWS